LPACSAASPTRQCERHRLPTSCSSLLSHMRNQEPPSTSGRSWRQQTSPVITPHPKACATASVFVWPCKLETLVLCKNFWDIPTLKRLLFIWIRLAMEPEQRLQGLGNDNIELVGRSLDRCGIGCSWIGNCCG